MAVPGVSILCHVVRLVDRMAVIMSVCHVMLSAMHPGMPRDTKAIDPRFPMLYRPLFIGVTVVCALSAHIKYIIVLFLYVWAVWSTWEHVLFGLTHTGSG